MVLEISYATRLDRILLGVVWLTELILDEEFLVDGIRSITLFLLGIVPTKGGGGTLVPDEITVDTRKLPFSTDAIDINLVGLEAIEYLCPSVSVTQAAAISKHGVSGDNFFKAGGLHKRETGFDMAL